MGANSSTIEDSRAFVATASTATPVAFAPSYDDYPTNRKAALQERSASMSGYLPPRKPKINNNPNRIMAFHSKASWSAYLESSKAFPNLVLIYFTTTWYEPCRYMEPTFNALAANYTNVEFIKIDVDDLSDISHHYAVRTTPTFLFIKKGKEIDRVVGAKKDELQTKIDKHT